MTKSQKNSVDEMLAVGISIPKIAAFLHVSQNSIKSYLQRNHPNNVCLNCGTPVLQVPHRKQKKFCCDACRMHYWNTHPQEMQHENAATIPCAFCGTPVLSYRNFLKSGLLTQSEFVQCEQTLAEKCGLSLGSIFRESA